MDYEKKYKEALELARVAAFNGHQSLMEGIFPELCESENEKIRKEIIKYTEGTFPNEYSGIESKKKWLAWLEKQSGQKPTQEIKPFEAEHGKYYYCIKDYFCGGRKQASKGDVIQALRGLPIMGLKDASEYFMPVNFIKCNSAWSEEDEKLLYLTVDNLEEIMSRYGELYGLVGKCITWLKSLKDRVQPQPKQEWSNEDERIYQSIIDDTVQENQLNEEQINWLKSLRHQRKWKPTKEQMDALLFVVQHYTPKVTDKLAWDSLKTLELMYYEIKQ